MTYADMRGRPSNSPSGDVVVMVIRVCIRGDKDRADMSVLIELLVTLMDTKKPGVNRAAGLVAFLALCFTWRQ